MSRFASLKTCSLVRNEKRLNSLSLNVCRSSYVHYILGVLILTTACDRHWEEDKTLKWLLMLLQFRPGGAFMEQPGLYFNLGFWGPGLYFKPSFWGLQNLKTTGTSPGRPPIPPGLHLYNVRSLASPHLMNARGLRVTQNAYISF